MKLYAYELNPFIAVPIIEVKEFSARENKNEYFSSAYPLPISAFQTKGGWYIDKKDIGKRACVGIGGYIYVICHTDGEMNKVKKILISKLIEIIEKDRENLNTKEKSLDKLMNE